MKQSVAPRQPVALVAQQSVHVRARAAAGTGERLGHPAIQPRQHGIGAEVFFLRRGGFAAIEASSNGQRGQAQSGQQHEFLREFVHRGDFRFHRSVRLPGGHFLTRTANAIVNRFLPGLRYTWVVSQRKNAVFLACHKPYFATASDKEKQCIGGLRGNQAGTAQQSVAIKRQ